jgi:hypothetical protein
MFLEIYEKLQPMTVDEIKKLTAHARALPPSGDQSHVLIADGHSGRYHCVAVICQQNQEKLARCQRRRGFRDSAIAKQ